MTDRNAFEPGPGEEPDPGRPIEALAGLRVEPRPGFVDRVRHRIFRRRLASDVVGLAWIGPTLVLLQFLEMLFGMFGRKGPGEGGRA